MEKEFTVFGRKYYVDENGKVVNSYGKTMKSRVAGREYPYFEFRKNENGKKKRKRIYCHRLVAELFIPNPNGLSQVNHKDGNKENSNVENLEWVTPGENQTHSRYTLMNTTGYEDRPVICIETNQRFRSTKEAERATGALCSHICECASGKRKTTGGYHWGYL